MARFVFKLPDIGEGIAEAEIVAWHVTVGSKVKEDEPLADLMTDKATVEMESPVSGTIVELAGEVGDEVAIGAPLLVIETGDVAVSPVGDAVPPALESACVITAADRGSAIEGSDLTHQEESPTRNSSNSEHWPNAESSLASPAPPRAVTEGATSSGRGVLASPAVRARARELGLDLSQVRAGGDRIRHTDLDAFLRYGAHRGYRAPGRASAAPDREIRIVGLRRRIAENMAASKRAIPHFSFVEEVDVTALEELRRNLNDNRGILPRLTLLPLLIVAICKAIPQFPMMNARFDDERGVVTQFGRIHLGMATQTEAGLMVPVIRDAQDLNVWQLATEIGRLAEAARTGKARSEDLSGSTLTVTSLGPLGGIATTPVVNRPEVAIIGPNRIVERPIYRGSEIVRGKLMNISISCDHRVIDGWDAASFLHLLKKSLETPVLLFAD